MINSIKHTNKRVREEKTNTRIFTWFGNPCLRPRLQAHRDWGFHYPSLSRLQALTIDFQGVNGPLQQEIILNLLTQVYPNTYDHSMIKIINEFSLTQCVWLQMYAQYVNKWIKNEFKTQWMLYSRLQAQW